MLEKTCTIIHIPWTLILRLILKKLSGLKKHDEPTPLCPTNANVCLLLSFWRNGRNNFRCCLNWKCPFQCCFDSASRDISPFAKIKCRYGATFHNGRWWYYWWSCRWTGAVRSTMKRCIARQNRCVGCKILHTISCRICGNTLMRSTFGFKRWKGKLNHSPKCIGPFTETFWQITMKPVMEISSKWHFHHSINFSKLAPGSYISILIFTFKHIQVMNIFRIYYAVTPDK